MNRVEHAAGVLLFPSYNFGHALHLNAADSSSELVHAEIEAVHGVVELAIIAVLAGEIDQIPVAADQHTAFTCGEGLGGIKRINARITPGARPLTVPLCPMCVSTVFQQPNIVLAAVGGDLLYIEGNVSTDMDQPDCYRIISLSLGHKVFV